MIDIFGSLVTFLEKMLSYILSVFPQDPFLPYLSSFKESLSPYINYLNWFINFNHFKVILITWLGSIALFYVWMTLGRWLKVVGD